MSAGFFITGTDTEIGKTTVTAGMTYALAERGVRVAPVKSLAAGQAQLANGHWLNEDVAQLHAVQRLGMTPAQVGPIQFKAACAPHVAAELEGQRIAREPTLAAIRASMALGELALVEGVGGFRVPLNADWDTADLAQDLGLPVVLVVGLRLGCINHALLTVEAIAARGLRLAAWVANTADADQPHQAANVLALRERLAAPCVGVVPRLKSPSAANVAAQLGVAALDRLLRTA